MTCVAPCTYRKSTYNLMIKLESLEQQEQSKPSSSRQRRRVKAREKSTRGQTKPERRIRMMRAWFFEKIPKLDRHLAEFIQRRPKGLKLVPHRRHLKIY